jgi:hypothetical protein
MERSEFDPNKTMPPVGPDDTQPPVRAVRFEHLLEDVQQNRKNAEMMQHFEDALTGLFAQPVSVIGFSYNREEGVFNVRFETGGEVQSQVMKAGEPLPS